MCLGNFAISLQSAAQNKTVESDVYYRKGKNLLRQFGRETSKNKHPSSVQESCPRPYLVVHMHGSRTEHGRNYGELSKINSINTFLQHFHRCTCPYLVAHLLFSLAQQYQYMRFLRHFSSTCYAIVPVQILRGPSNPHPEWKIKTVKVHTGRHGLTRPDLSLTVHPPLPT